MPSGRSQTQKDSHPGSLFIGNLWSQQTQGDGKQISGCLGLGRVLRGMAERCGVSFGGDENLL